MHHGDAVRQARGFSLLEVLVAMSIVAVGVAALAQLSIVAIRATDSAKTTTVAAVLAQQKMEQLRGLTWGIDALGMAVSDTTTDVVSGGSSADGFGLSASPADALRRNTPGYCDFVDGSGHSLGGGPAPPSGAVYVRRWSVTPLPANPDHTLVLQVLVSHVRDRSMADAADSATRRPGEVRLVSVKTRKAAVR